MLTIFRDPKITRWTNLILSFLLGQGLVQILGLLSGFLLLRWFSKEAYAQYSVAFSFQSTLSLFIDIGFTGSIIALVGDQGHDPKILGNYIRSARFWRNRMFWIVIPLSGVILPLMVAKQNWSILTQALLFGSVAFSIFFEGWVAYYSAPLLIHQNIKKIYQVPILLAAGRLGLNFIFYLSSALTAWSATWINSFSVLINGYFYRIHSASLLIEPEESDPEINRRIRHYISPLIPGILFTAFQGQISLFLITIFGKTSSIAEVAALGRLGQLFIVLSAFNGVVISPYIAKVKPEILWNRYLLFLGSAIGLSIFLSGGAFLFPQPLLWLLGSKYQHLQSEVGLIILTSCVGYVGGLMWTIHSGRKWIYWWGGPLYISIVLLTQSVCILTLDLASTSGVILFSLFTSGAIIVVHLINAIYGFTHGSPLETTA